MVRRNEEIIPSLNSYPGKPYIQAAKDTWHLLTDRGIDAVINDTIVNLGMCYMLASDTVNSSSSDDLGELLHWTPMRPLFVHLSPRCAQSVPS